MFLLRGLMRGGPKIPKGTRGHMYVANTDAANGMHQKIVVGKDAESGYGQSFGVHVNDAEMFPSVASQRPQQGKKGTGVVYRDQDPPTQIAKKFEMTPEEDALVIKELQKDLGAEGSYNLLTNNCRVYSKERYRAMKRMIEERRKQQESEQ